MRQRCFVLLADRGSLPVDDGCTLWCSWRQIPNRRVECTKLNYPSTLSPAYTCRDDATLAVPGAHESKPPLPAVEVHGW